MNAVTARILRLFQLKSCNNTGSLSAIPIKLKTLFSRDIFGKQFERVVQHSLLKFARRYPMPLQMREVGRIHSKSTTFLLY